MLWLFFAFSVYYFVGFSDSPTVLDGGLERMVVGLDGTFRSSISPLNAADSSFYQVGFDLTLIQRCKDSLVRWFSCWEYEAF